mmetsp:Transcript_12743/g.25542  ORF Transcript_12743/g.25542 Transcript_12743/m.25542 type:complete len:210 (-) Transcript_12743:2376-3005(-)
MLPLLKQLQTIMLMSSEHLKRQCPYRQCKNQHLQLRCQWKTLQSPPFHAKREHMRRQRLKTPQAHMRIVLVLHVLRRQSLSTERTQMRSRKINLFLRKTLIPSNQQLKKATPLVPFQLRHRTTQAQRTLSKIFRWKKTQLLPLRPLGNILLLMRRQSKKKMILVNFQLSTRKIYRMRLTQLSLRSMQLQKRPQLKKATTLATLQLPRIT